MATIDSAPTDIAKENPVTLEVHSLTKEFDIPTGIEVAVDDISFSVTNGEFVSVVGPSGCGKTTTLRCVAGLEDPTRGEITIDGHDIVDIPPNRRNMAMMFQNIALYPHMTLKKNIGYPLKVRNIDRDERDREIRKAAELMQIDSLLDKYPGEVSGGQRQRAALARTIVQDPEVFLMDEPLSDLDAKLKAEMRKEIQRIHKRVNIPTIYVTHDQEEAMTMSDKILVLNNGRIEQVGTPSEVYNQPKNTFVASFIGNPEINLLPCEIAAVDGDEATVQIDGTAFDVTLGSSIEGYTDSEAKLGVRPEDVELNERGGIPVEITLTERIGDRVMTTLHGAGQELRAFVSAGSEYREEATIQFEFDRQRFHLFDSETDECIGRGANLAD